jgi:hypothetical protein
MKTSEPISGKRETSEPPAKKPRTIDMSAEFNQERWADVRLRLVSKSDESVELLWAHGLVLRLESDFFKALLSKPWSSSGNPDRTISFNTNEERHAFIKMIECLYTGHVPTRPLEEWAAIWGSADYFGCTHLHAVLAEEMIAFHNRPDGDSIYHANMEWLCSSMATGSNPHLRRITRDALLVHRGLFRHGVEDVDGFPNIDDIKLLPVPVFEYLLDLRHDLRLNPATENDYLALICAYCTHHTPVLDPWPYIIRYVEPMLLGYEVIAGMLLVGLPDEAYTTRIRYALLCRNHCKPAFGTEKDRLSTVTRHYAASHDDPSLRVQLKETNLEEMPKYVYYNGVTYAISTGFTTTSKRVVTIATHVNHYATVSPCTAFIRLCVGRIVIGHCSSTEATDPSQTLFFGASDLTTWPVNLDLRPGAQGEAMYKPKKTESLYS